MPFLLLSLLSSDTASISKLNTAFSQKIGMSEFLHRLLRPPEGASFGSHPLTIVAAAAGFWLLFAVFQYTGWVVPSTGKKLSREEALEWNIRAVSTIHAIVLVIGMHRLHDCGPYQCQILDTFVGMQIDTSASQGVLPTVRQRSCPLPAIFAPS